MIGIAWILLLLLFLDQKKVNSNSLRPRVFKCQFISSLSSSIYQPTCTYYSKPPARHHQFTCIFPAAVIQLKKGGNETNLWISQRKKRKEKKKKAMYEETQPCYAKVIQPQAFSFSFFFSFLSWCLSCLFSFFAAASAMSCSNAMKSPSSSGSRSACFRVSSCLDV